MTNRAASPPRRFFRPTWAEVDLTRLRANLRRLRSKTPGARLMFVVKANAYGHGAARCAMAAERAALADWLGVSSVEEGIALRAEGVKLPILVLGSLYPFESFLAAVEHGLTPTVASLESAQRLVRVARSLGRRVECHLKVETGMGRIGVSPAAAVGVAQFLSAEPSVRVAGAYTHLASAGEDAAFTRLQLSRFSQALAGIKRPGLPAPLRHAANSAAALLHRAARLDMIRPGLAAYGLYPGFDPVLSLKSKVVFIKTVTRGTPISYGGAFKTRRSSRIATIPIGYADGWLRRYSDDGAALVRGRRCPIVGRVTMDMTMLDVTDAPEARVGDDAVLIGAQGRERITAADVATRARTIPYEVVSLVSPRVPRVYLP